MAVTSDYVAYPNPANTTLTVAKSSDNPAALTFSAQQSVLNFKIILYDKTGKIVRSAQNTKNSQSINIDLLGIKDDIYYLHIVDGDKVVEKQIIIAH